MTKSSTKNTMCRTIHYFLEAYGQAKVLTIIEFVILFVRQVISWVVVPVGTSQIIGKLSEGDFEFSHYVPLLLVVFVPTLINDIIMRLADWIDRVLDARGGEYLSNKSFSAIIRQSSNFHNNHFSGSLISQSNKLANAFVNFKSCISWNFFPLVCGVILSSVTVFQIAPIYGIILLGFSIAFSIAAFITFRNTAKHDDEYSEAAHKQSGAVSDSISNAFSVKSFAREEYEERRIKKVNHSIYDATIGLAKASLLRNGTLGAIIFITEILMLVLIICGAKMFNLSVANAVLLYTLTNNIIGQLWNINNGVFRVLNRAFSDAKEMVEILDAPNLVVDKTNNKLEVRTAEIEFHDITFKYNGTKVPVFEHFSLKIPAGKRVGLVGVSGSGKTTLTKLLLRFSDVDGGNVLVDGQEIDMVTQASLRESIAYVPQESALFHRTIAENIAYGKPNATMEEIKRAAHLANADDFIDKMPNGYQTLVGERGVKLSGGQRQRIAIARAILKDAPILILDEATSALDSESEALIQEALSNLMKGRTSIVVAHRLSTIAGLDEIVVLKNGKIIERGSHRSLLLKDGAYKKLWSRQSGAFLDEE